MALGERQKDKRRCSKTEVARSKLPKDNVCHCCQGPLPRRDQTFSCKIWICNLETFLIELFPISAASAVMTTAVVVTHGGIRAQGQSSSSLWRIFWPKLQSHELKEQRTALNQSSMGF